MIFINIFLFYISSKVHSKFFPAFVPVIQNNATNQQNLYIYLPYIQGLQLKCYSFKLLNKMSNIYLGRNIPVCHHEVERT